MKILISVLGFGYLGIYLANLIADFAGFWVLAGASSGVLALWAYAGLRMNHEANLGTIERAASYFLLIGIPFFLLDQLFLTDPPHTAHVIGLILGCLFYVFEVVLDSHTQITLL